ncbi:MAG: hypothetical protein R6V45_13155 [Oceanipulchritudo sp.]
MLLITTALMIEARPLVSALGLKAVGEGPFPVYEGGDRFLLVTGTGSLRASAATGWALGHHPGIEAALNIGFCGASPGCAPLHAWRYVHSVRDETTGRMSIPDILLKHPFEEAALMTVPRVVSEDSGQATLVDMEGSGFYEAARQVLPPDRIALLKWVSDALTGRIDPERAARAYAGSLEPVVAFIRNWGGVGNPSREAVGDPLAEEILSRLRLTRTQESQLRKWVSGYLARGGDRGRLTGILPADTPDTRPGNTRAFNHLRDVLES